jgi:hypothetical protein
MTKQVKSLGKILKGLRDGEQMRAFSEEDYKVIIESNPQMKDDFMIDLEGNFVYLGSKLDTLSQVLAQNIQSTVAQTKK